MATPAFLKSGDTIGFAATANRISPENLKTAAQWFESAGFRVLIPDSIYENHHQMAGEDTLRIERFQNLLDDDNVRAIFCVSGGYGTVRMIDRLDFSNFIKHPKWICGFSDITVLHAHIAQNFNIPTIHSAMSKVACTDNLVKLTDVLKGKPLNYCLPPHPLNRPGKATARLVGGNLSVLYSLTGSSSDLQTEGCILFLEDVFEYLYHIDRMMMNFKRAGKLRHLAGLIIGGFSNLKDNEVPFGKTAEEIISEHCAGLNIPILFGFPAGHIETNYPLILGQSVSLEVTACGAEVG